MASNAIARSGIMLAAALTAAVFLAACQPVQVAPPVGTETHAAFVLSAKPSDAPAIATEILGTLIPRTRLAPPRAARMAVAMAAPVAPDDPYAKTPPPARAPPAPARFIV